MFDLLTVKNGANHDWNMESRGEERERETRIGREGERKRDGVRVMEKKMSRGFAIKPVSILPALIG